MLPFLQAGVAFQPRGLQVGPKSSNMASKSAQVGAKEVNMASPKRSNMGLPIPKRPKNA